MDIYGIVCAVLSIIFALVYIIGLVKVKPLSQRNDYERIHKPKWFAYLISGIGFVMTVVYIPIIVILGIFHIAESSGIAAVVSRVVYFIAWNTFMAAILVKYWMQYYDQKYKREESRHLWHHMINAHICMSKCLILFCFECAVI